MFKTFTTSAAVIALSLQAASAAPFGSAVSTGEAGQAERSGERNGVASFVMNRIAAMVVGKVGHSTDDLSQYQYYSDVECEAAESAIDDDSEESQPKKAEPVGPEPIYFGF